MIRRSLLKAFGSMKAAAISMRIDQSQLNRELESQRFSLSRLYSDGVQDGERAAFFQQMHEEHALLTPGCDVPVSMPEWHYLCADCQREQAEKAGKAARAAQRGTR